MRPCSDCGTVILSADGWDDGHGGKLCQDCWEFHCSRGWWEECKDLEPTGEPDTYRRVRKAPWPLRALTWFLGKLLGTVREAKRRAAYEAEARYREEHPE